MQEKTDLSEEGRFSIWSSGLFVLSETLLIGTGVGGISKAMSIYTTNTVLVMHNLFIEILVEFGLICGIVVFAYMFKLYKRTFKIIDTSRQLLLKCSLYASPFYFIINSVYLLYPMTFLFFASLYVFAFYERIKVSRM